MMRSFFASASHSISDNTNAQHTQETDIRAIDDYKVGVWITRPTQASGGRITDHHALIIYSISHDSNIIIHFTDNNLIYISQDVELSQWFLERKPNDLTHALEIVKRALLLYHVNNEYNVWSNNCEHFVNWCYYGDKYSYQVKQAQYSLINGVCTGSMGMTYSLYSVYKYLAEARKMQQNAIYWQSRHAANDTVWYAVLLRKYNIYNGISYVAEMHSVSCLRKALWAKKMAVLSAVIGMVGGFGGYLCYTKYKQKRKRHSVYQDEDGRSTNFEKRCKQRIMQYLTEFIHNIKDNLFIIGLMRKHCELNIIPQNICDIISEYYFRSKMIEDILDIVESQ